MRTRFLAELTNHPIGSCMALTFVPEFDVCKIFYLYVFQKLKSK